MPVSSEVEMMLDKDKIKRENILQIGVCSLSDLEERVKAFRVMNQNSKKKRFIVSREQIKNSNDEVIVDKAEDIDISKVKLLRRFFKPDFVFKTFSPDEGFVIVSDMSTPEGIRLSMDLVTQVMNLGGGSYEAFIDRVDNFSDLLKLYNKGLFPKLIVIGYLIPGNIRIEKINFGNVKKIDPHTRVLEISHSELKTTPNFPNVKQLFINTGEEKSWQGFILEIISEYTKSYFTEDYN